MKASVIAVLAGIMVLIAVITNPTPEDHREAVREAIFAVLPTESDMAVVEVLANGFGRTAYDQFASKMVTRQNFVFFSLTKVTLSKNHRKVGIGLFGNVFLFKEFRKKLLAAFTGDSPPQLSENPTSEEMELFMEKVYSEDYLTQVISDLKNTQIRQIDLAEGITGGSKFQTFGNFIETLLRKMDVDKAHYKALNMKDDPNSVCNNPLINRTGLVLIL